MKILFVDVVHPFLEEKLNQLGCSCDHDYSSSKKDIASKIDSYEGLVIRSRFPIDQTFLDQATNLKFIARSGAGLENIDLVYAKEKGVHVFNSPEGNMDAVGEQAIGMLLMLFNQLKKGDSEVRNGVWDREGNRGLEISGKTIGIIGYGNMGKAFAKKLSGFDCKVIAHDKYKTTFSDEYVQEVTLTELQQQAQVISIHLPLTTATKYYVDEQFISACAHPFYLINTARGNHINTNNLVNGLESNKVLGACLDVLEYETKSFETINARELPMAYNYLCDSDKVILSPHVAGWTEESYVKLSSFLAEKIETTFFKK